MRYFVIFVSCAAALSTTGLIAGPAGAAPRTTTTAGDGEAGAVAPAWELAPDGFVPGLIGNASKAGPYLSQEAVDAMLASDAGDVDQSSEPARSLRAVAIGCNPATGADDPHLSSTGWAVSAHGWWNKGSCSGATAHVTGRLYEWYTNGSSGGWVFKAKGGPSKLKPSNSGGGRVTARKDCEASTLTDWLNVVDVDVDGQIDNGELGQRKMSVSCRAWAPAS
jgi:hypothetical protein